MTNDATSTTELCDQLKDKARFLSPRLASFGGRSRFHGEVVTLKCIEDSSRIKEAITHPGTGKVLVVDAGASERCAVFGDMSAETALENGWEGVVVYGYIRDVQRIREMPLGLRALGVVPKGSTRRDQGLADLPVDIGGVMCHPGDQLFADEDGIVVVSKADVPLVKVQD